MSLFTNIRLISGELSNEFPNLYVAKSNKGSSDLIYEGAAKQDIDEGTIKIGDVLFIAWDVTDANVKGTEVLKVSDKAGGTLIKL